MRNAFSLIFELITDPLALPISPIYEYIILAIVGEAAFQFAWKISPGGFFGSIIHWCARIITYVLMWAVVYMIIEVARFVIAHKIPILCIAVGLTVTSIILEMFIKQRMEKQNLND